MTAKNDTGGPAFPRVVEQPNGYTQAVEGMTLRDYFAAKAMQGYMSIPGGVNPKWDARLAYEIADAMLVERSKQ